ncbi:MAG: tlde1 domain-containing protein [Pseudolabrys sp.]
MVASRVSSVSSQAARARQRSARRHTVSIVLSGIVLSGLAFGSAGMALFGTGSGFGRPAPEGLPHKGFQVALADRAPMAQHHARLQGKDDNRQIAVLTPPTPAASSPARNVTVLAKTSKPAPQTRAAGDRPKDDLKTPYQLASADTGVTPAPAPLARAVRTVAITRDSVAEADITGSLGKSAEAKSSDHQLAPAPGKVALAAPTKPDAKNETKADTRSHAISPEAIKAESPKPVIAKVAPPKPSRPLTPHEKLYGPVRLASLSPVTPDTVPNSVRDANGGLPVAPYDRNTAVYVITSKRVYLPDGTSLEAHSGLGQYMDNPKFAHLRMRGVTPPHVYTMKMREALFHGVEAIRLNPIGGERAIFGRDGLLAQTYMLGPNGQSNGCVSFKDYRAFLNAFKSGRINRLAVISHLD